MDIYIIRDGREAGPFSEDAIRGMLRVGRAQPSEPAWMPGLPAWTSLDKVLNGAHPPEPAALIKTTEFATNKQKAFLSYMGVSFGLDLQREEAARLVKEATEHPSDPARLARWEHERLRLYPDIFATEVQAKRENRVNELFAMVTTEGAECFQNVSKAHCQVLVSYLDIKFPNWDANENVAARNYFFPAIAEKFPQLVTREWRNKLKYPQGSKVSPELTQLGAPPPHRKRRVVFKTAAIIGLIMAVGGWFLWRPPELGSQRRINEPSVPESKNTKVNPEKGKPVPSLPAAALPDAPKTEPLEPRQRPPTATPSIAGTSENVPIPKSSSQNPNAPTPAPAVAPRTAITLTKPVEIRMAYGNVTLRPGVILKLVSLEGKNVKVTYLNNVISVPIASTDLGASP